MTDRPQVPDAVERAEDALEASVDDTRCPTHGDAASLLYEALRELLALFDGEVVTGEVVHDDSGEFPLVEPRYFASFPWSDGTKVVVLRLPEVE